MGQDVRVSRLPWAFPKKARWGFQDVSLGLVSLCKMFGAPYRSGAYKSSGGGKELFDSRQEFFYGGTGIELKVIDVF